MRLEKPLSRSAYTFQLYHRPIRRMGLDPLFYGAVCAVRGQEPQKKNNGVLILSFNPYNRGGTTIITILQMSKMRL